MSNLVSPKKPKLCVSCCIIHSSGWSRKKTNLHKLIQEQFKEYYATGVTCETYLKSNKSAINEPFIMELLVAEDPDWFKGSSSMGTEPELQLLFSENVEINTINKKQIGFLEKHGDLRFKLKPIKDL